MATVHRAELHSLEGFSKPVALKRMLPRLSNHPDIVSSFVQEGRLASHLYHPNIAPHAICIGDHWSAGESLATLIARIGEIITFQSYNVKSPLNGEAARWAEQNVARLPLQKIDLTARA